MPAETDHFFIRVGKLMCSMGLVVIFLLTSYALHLIYEADRAYQYCETPLQAPPDVPKKSTAVLPTP